MDPQEEYDFYADPNNRKLEGKPVHRRLSEPVPVRFPNEQLARIRELARRQDRSVSSWLRIAAEHELARNGD